MSGYIPTSCEQARPRWRPHGSPSTTKPFSSSQLRNAAQVGSLPSVRRLPTTMRPRFARVSMTLRRRSSRRNPMPWSLLRTALTTMSSFSWPWKPSTELTCTDSWPLGFPRCCSSRAGSTRWSSRTCAAYGEMTPTSPGASSPASKNPSSNRATTATSAALAAEVPTASSAPSTCTKATPPRSAFGQAKPFGGRHSHSGTALSRRPS
mmetsp:Transcript_57592/g.148657  ORF Transcript_57592/g.148657 Transcript_57592/m.148657 type:complete len:207 (+) Transcript_57592:13-633(+)